MASVPREAPAHVLTGASSFLAPADTGRKYLHCLIYLMRTVDDPDGTLTDATEDVRSVNDRDGKPD